MFRIAHDSPLCGPHTELSEKQIILLDGIRYSADMAGIAFDRLWKTLQSIDVRWAEATSSDIAEAALDAWSIIDAANRFHDLILNFPGLPNTTWRRIFNERVAVALELRNCWQHQRTEVDANVAGRRQAWGAIAWAKHIEETPTGLWCLIVAGTELEGSRWIFAGPSDEIPREDSRRIRLLHGDHSFYLGRAVRDMFEAVAYLEEMLRNGEISLQGVRVNRERCRDAFFLMELLGFVDKGYPQFD